MEKRKVVTVATFLGACVWTITTSATYPIAIWVAGFVAIEKVRFRKQQHQCPMLQLAMSIAASKEEGTHVVDKNCGDGYEGQSARCADAIQHSGHSRNSAQPSRRMTS